MCGFETIIYQPNKTETMKAKTWITRNSKHIFYLLLTAGLFSCQTNLQIDEARIVNDLECPVILFAKSNATDEDDASITLKDGNGKFTSFVCRRAFSASIHSTYNVGDTLRACR